MTQRLTLGRSELGQTLAAFRREFSVVGFYSLLANALMLTPALYMLQVYDRVLVSQNVWTLLVVSLLSLGLLALMALAEWLRSRVLVRVSMRLDDALSRRVFQAAFDASLRPNAARQGRAFSDLIELRQFITGNGVYAFFDLPWSPIYTAVLFVMHPLLGWLAVAFACVQGALAFWGHRLALQPNEELQLRQADEQGELQTRLRNVEAIAAMGMKVGLKHRWSRQHQAVLDQHAHVYHRQVRITALSKFVRLCQQSFMLGAGGLLAIQGEITAGAMIAANVLAGRALAPIDMVVATWRAFLSARAAFGRLRTLLHEHPPRQCTVTESTPQGQLRLVGVSAFAPGREQPILHDVTLDCESGTLTVIIGPSGSGKSTLARAMIGIWPEVSGQVVLDSEPLSAWSREALGPHLGYLPQDVELFDGTVADNIARMGKPDPEKVIRAAQSTGLHEVILRLPKGYDTPIGEAGQLLSGGQRQRLALARALYGQPRLIVLDEPNAHLDDAGEAALLAALQTERQAGATLVLITHRPGVLQAADRIVVLREGRIVAQGARDDILPKLASPHPPLASIATQPLPTTA